MTTGEVAPRAAEDEHGVALRTVVRSRIVNYARSLGAPTADWIEEGVVQARHSFVIPFSVDGCITPGFVVKVHRGTNARNAAATEYANLLALHECLGGRQCRVPRPLDHLPEHAAIVMERVVGQRLDTVIGEYACRLRSHGTWPEAWCERAGGWLAELETCAPVHECDLDERLESYHRTFTSELDSIAQGARCAGASLHLTNRVVTRLKAIPAPDPVQLTKIHSDFAPYNVLGSDDALYVVDFSEMPLGLTAQCGGFFWAALEVTALHPAVSRPKVKACQDHFQAGLGTTICPEWRVWGLFRHLSYIPADRSGVPVALRIWNRWRAKRIQGLLSRLLASDIRRVDGR